jgi:hypothetical protein
MQYLLTMTYRDGEGAQEGTPEFAEEMKAWGAINEELKAAGQMIAGSGLKPETATTVRGEVVTDGPYAETKEILFSFYIVDLPDLDAAIALARRLPASQYGSVTITAMTHFEIA